MTIGNENTVKIGEQVKNDSAKHETEMMREKTIQYFERVDSLHRRVTLIREQNDEILKRLKTMVSLLNYYSFCLTQKTSDIFSSFKI